jgi:hypothetical protein
MDLAASPSCSMPCCLGRREHRYGPAVTRTARNASFPFVHSLLPRAAVFICPALGPILRQQERWGSIPASTTTVYAGTLPPSPPQALAWGGFYDDALCAPRPRGRAPPHTPATCGLSPPHGGTAPLRCAPLHPPTPRSRNPNHPEAAPLRSFRLYPALSHPHCRVPHHTHSGGHRRLMLMQRSGPQGGREPPAI